MLYTSLQLSNQKVESTLDLFVLFNRNQYSITIYHSLLRIETG